MSVLLAVSVSGDPVPKGRPRMDPRSGHAYTPARTAVAEADLRERVWALLPAGFAPLTGELAVRLRFWLGNRRKRDLDNLQKLAWDALNGVVWIDDAQIKHVEATIMGIDKAAARTELEVHAWDPEQPEPRQSGRWKVGRGVRAVPR